MNTRQLIVMALSVCINCILLLIGAMIGSLRYRCFVVVGQKVPYKKVPLYRNSGGSVMYMYVFIIVYYPVVK